MMQTVADNVKSHKQAYLERWQVAIECDIWQRTGDLGEVSLSEVVQAEVWLKCLGESARTEELRNLVWSVILRGVAVMRRIVFVVVLFFILKN